MDDKEIITTHLGFRGDEALVARVDKAAETISDQMGVVVSRSAVMRMLLTRGLDAFEKEAA